MLFCIFALLAALTLVGAFWDYEIANAVYIGESFEENPFGIIFAYVGIIPAFLGWSFFGASIIALIRRSELTKRKRGWLKALAVILLLLSCFYFPNTLMLVNANAFSVHFLIAYPIGISAIVGAAYLGYRMAKSSDNPRLLSRVSFIAIVSIAAVLIIASTKGIMDRPRFRLVLSESDPRLFKSFWQRGSEIKAELFGDAVSDEFSSFPSGHSAYSMLSVLVLPLIAEYKTECFRYKRPLAALGFVWWAATALSRMTVGAHYLTDVSIAAIVTLTVYAVSCFIDKKLDLRSKL